MSRVVARRYRVRFAQLGADEVTDATVDFELDLGILTTAPVVAGSFAHPLDGRTEMRPLTVEGIDKDLFITQALTANERWNALGRLVDIQWQSIEDDADVDAWTTYGTGRCSGLEERDGPGKYACEISDENWLGRRGKIFTEADSTQLWPSGMAFEWRGFEAALQASGSVTDTSGNYYKISLQASGRGSLVRPELVDWIKRDIRGGDDFTPVEGFEHLRLRYPAQGGQVTFWEVVSFGSSPVFSMESIEEAAELEGDSFHLWIEWPGIPFDVPASSGDAALYAPTAPPSDDLPLHVGGRDDEHYWATPDSSDFEFFFGRGGYLHPADLSRRAFEALGMRYDDDALIALEADISLPALAPYILATPDDPIRWLEDEVWGPNLLMALRDAQGRIKVADLRPPNENADLSGYPVLTNANSKDHHWRIVGREMMNSVRWRYRTFTQAEALMHPPVKWVSLKYGDVSARVVDDPDGPPLTAGVSELRLDDLQTREDEIGPFDSDNIDLVGERAMTFSAHAPLEPLTLLAWPGTIARISSVTLSNRATLWLPEQVVDFLLTVYQDGPFHGNAEISGTLAETLEEGDYAIVDCSDVKIPNAMTEARTGYVLVIVLSLTRHPAHAEIEYLVYRPVLLFECPDPDDEETWLYSPLNQNTTMRMRMDLDDPSPSLLNVAITARKNADGGQQVNMGVAIYEGVTEVASWTETDIGASFADYDFTLSSGQQAGITNWANLYLDISREGETGGPEGSYRRLEIAEIAQ